MLFEKIKCWKNVSFHVSLKCFSYNLGINYTDQALQRTFLKKRVQVLEKQSKVSLTMLRMYQIRYLIVLIVILALVEFRSTSQNLLLSFRFILTTTKTKSYIYVYIHTYLLHLLVKIKCCIIYFFTFIKKIKSLKVTLKCDHNQTIEKEKEDPI